MKRKNCIAKACFFILVFLVSIISCEVGLGSAVDTQPPSVAIDGPKVDAVIRDVFAITGRWSDDGSISEVKATLKRTNGNAKEVEIPGEWNVDPQLKETGTWKVLVDYEKENLVDGTYQATVSVKDNGKHITTQSTTFTIDNTAPVLVLSRPSIKDGQSGFDNYGRSFTLEGKAADDNEVSLIEVNVFENADSTEPLKTVELRNVPLTIEQDVAVYEAGKENDYSAIYKDTDFGKAAQRYCMVTIYDGAQRYPADGSAQTEADKKGNSTNTYYMNSEITSLLQGSVKITDLYHMMNGSYGAGEARSASNNNVIEQLETYKVSKGKFSINPANNPKFIVSSASVLEQGKDLDSVDYQLTSGNRYIEVEVSPGLDGYAIDPDSVEVYLQECDKNGNITGTEKIVLIKAGSEYHKTTEEAQAAADAGTPLESGYGVYSVSGNTYKFKTSKVIKNPDYEVSAGQYYRIQVAGHDTQEDTESGKISSDGDYGFKLVSNEEKIEVLVEGVPDYLSKNEDAWKVEGHKKFTTTLTWNTGSGDFFVYRQKSDGTYELVETTIIPTENGWKASENFTYEKFGPSGLNFPTDLVYVLKNSDDGGDVVSTPARIKIKYDDKPPEITNVQFLNSYLKTEKINDETIKTYFVRNENGNLCDITGIATDNIGIESVALQVDSGSAENPLDPKENLDGQFKFEGVNYSTINGKTGVTTNIIATDKAGNQKPYSLTVVFDTEEPNSTHKLDSTNKDIVFRISDFDNNDITQTNATSDYNLTWNNATIEGKTYTDIDTKVGGKYSAGTFGNTTTIKVRGVFEDSGSGIKRIYYRVYDNSVDNKSDYILDAQNKPRYNLSEDDKNNFINEIISKNTYCEPSGDVEYKRVFYNVDKAAYDSASDNDKKTISLDGYKLQKKVENQLVDVVETKTVNGVEKQYYKFWKIVPATFSFTIPKLTEGSNYLAIVAEDNVGNRFVDTVSVAYDHDQNPLTDDISAAFSNFSMNLDTTAPTVDSNNTDIVYSNKTGDCIISVTAQDPGVENIENSSSGVKNVVFSRDGTSTTIKATASGNTYTANIKSILPDSGATSIYATVTDNASTSSKKVVANIIVDVKEPDVSIIAPSDANGDTTDIEVNDTISISGTSSDENGVSRIIGLIYKQADSATKPNKQTDFTIEKDLSQWQAPDGWEKVDVSPKDSNSTISWTFEGIDTSELEKTYAENETHQTTVFFSVAVQDRAGNIGFSTPQKVIIDQDTDRPVLHLSTLPLTYKYKDVNDQELTQRMDRDHPVWFNRSELSGTIDDDDGAVKSVKVIALDTTISGSPSETNWTAATNVYKNGIWSYTIPSNGFKKIYFQIKDATGNTFTSNIQSTASTNYGPKIQDTEANLFGYNTQDSCADDVIYVKVDTDDPVLEVMKYYTSSVLVADPTTIQDYNSYTQEPGWKIAESSIIPDKFGGTNKYLYIKCKTYDTNGISSISFKFGDISPLEGKTVEIPQQTGNENYKEVITCFNIKQGLTPVPSGLTKLEINIKDNAAANTGSNGISKYYDAMVDNDEPEINFSNYTKGSQVYGSSAVTLRGTTSDSSKVEKVEYALNTNGYGVPTEGWVEITDETKPTYTSKLGWQIVFDGKTPENDNTFTDPSSYHAALLKESLFSLYNVAQENQAGYDTTQKIYIWIRATDELGNMGTNSMKDLEALEDGFYLDVIPNGDRPAIEITYPADNSSVGGTIRITGTTDIQDTSASVQHVYLQIDPSYDKNAGFNESWAEELQPILTPKEGSQVISYSIKDLTGITVNGTDLGTKIGKGIVSQGNSKMNWYLTINGNKEFNGKVNNNNRTIGIRAVAVSSTGKVSFSEVHACTIDPDAPIFGQTNELRFVQYDGQNETASRKFENGVYLKGQWYLVGSVEDDSGIREIKLGSQSIVYSTGDEGEEVVTNASNGMIIDNNNIHVNEGSRFKNYDLKIPVGNSEVDKFGKLEYEISVTDGSTSQIENTLKFTIFYDNKAPDFAAQKGNEIPLATNGKIFQSNGSYTVKGTFAEPSEGTNNQSGFNRIAMFFTRKRVEDGNTNLYLIDPMIEDGEDGEKNFVKLGKLGNNGKVSNFESNISFKEGLYWRQVTASLENTNELTVAEGSLVAGKLPSNIRAGGLCMINNVIYRIKSISGAKLILEGTISDLQNKPVYFAFAQVIDNQSQESGVVGLYKDNDPTTNQDGDCMVEGVIFGAGIYNWNASIDSSNMLDGNATMSFVAYDAAGNYTEQSFEQKISNNAPRIAGVEFGTDINLDETISENEINKYYSGFFTHDANPSLNGYDNLGNRISSYTIPEKLTVKGDLMLKPMIVGGNKALGKQYSFSTTTPTGTYSSPVTQYDGVGHSNSNNVRTDDLTIKISLTDFITNNVKEDEQNITFTIWDKTDGSNLGDEASGSARADIILPVNVVINDNEAPTIEIAPFYWKSQTENSLYKGNVKNGHIELSGELPDDFNEATGVKDGDDKVSGKITFDGTATDNVIVQKIMVSITGYNGGNPIDIAERDKSASSTDGWKSTSLYYEKDGNAVEDAANTLDNKDWVFELLSDTYNDDGRNIVKFKFHFNTEKHPEVAKTDVTFEFTAQDKGSPSSTGVYTNAKTSTDDPRVDIVPYITKVYTSLAKLKSNNWSVYNRTALGHYAVASDETIYLYGFNLGSSTKKPVYKYGNNAGDVITLDEPENAGITNLGTEDDPIIPPYPCGTDYASYHVVGFNVSNVPASGAITLMVNSVPIQNNANNSNAKGSYAGTTTSATGDKTVYDNYYNRQPNGDNNNLLTDDVVLDVWEIDPTAVVPINGVTSQPVMSINPVNHDVGFAFVNGALYYSMPNGNSYSYDNFIGGFDYWTSVTMTYDSLGNSYGVAAGGDINESKADQFRIMTSRWGYADRDAGGYNRATNNLRLELIGQYDYTETTNAEGKHEGFRNFDKERIKSPSLATGAATGDSTNVYLAYYDAINDEIRFKRGGIKTTRAATWNNLNNADKTASFFGDYYGPNTDGTGGSEAGDKVLDNGKDYSKYRLVHNSWLAGQTSRIYDTSGNTRNAKVITTSGDPVYAGQYVSIAAIPNGGTSDDAVIAVWWDGENNQLLYSYNLTPNSITVGQYKQEDTKWTTPVPIFDSNIGEYCKLAVIKEGTGSNIHYSVHIVGYDGLNCDVWYAYIPNFMTPANKKTCLVDSYGLIGTELNIDVALDDSGNPIPYISYYAGSCAHPKTARWAGTTSIAAATTLKSVDELERFTGVWEVSVIPTQSRVSIDHVNIGVWKDSDGTITWSTTDGAAPGEGNIGETKLDYKEVFKSEDLGYKAGNTGYRTGGHVWGNGSKNPILGYSITKGASGNIETAQMK